MQNTTRKIWVLVAVALCCLVFAAPAHAGKRVALVIGNNAYENVPALQKAVNDAERDLARARQARLRRGLGRECRAPRHEPGAGRARKQDRERRHRAHLFRRTRLCRRRHQLSAAGRCACRRSWRGGSRARRVLCRQRPLGPAAGEGCRDRDPHPRRLPRQSVRASRQAQHRAHPRAFAHGSGGRHVRAVLGGARPVGARSLKRHRQEPELRVHPHAAEGAGRARPLHGADCQAHAKPGQGACRQGRSCAGAGLLRSDRRRPLSRA